MTMFTEIKQVLSNSLLMIRLSKLSLFMDQTICIQNLYLKKHTRNS